jgi:hypothetical protein
MHLTERHPSVNDSDRQAGATPEELRMAEKIWLALRRAAPDAAMAGDPRDVGMEVIFDGHFNMLQLVRLIVGDQN